MKRNTLFDGCQILTLDKKHDERGYFCRLSDSSWLPSGFEFHQISVSINVSPLTLRGIHFQKSMDKEYKIVSVIQGEIYDVLVDVRPESNTYLDYWSANLSSEDSRAILVAPGIAHGFLTLTPNTIVHYSMSDKFSQVNYSGLIWDDPKIEIAWPHIPLIISNQDQNWKRL